MKFKMLDSRKCLGDSLNVWMATEDKHIDSIQLQLGGTRSFGLRLLSIHQSKDISNLPDELFGSLYRTPPVYLTRVTNALVSPRPKNLPRYWLIFGSEHYLFQSASDSAKLALAEQGQIGFSSLTNEVEPYQPSNMLRVDGTSIWFNLFPNFNHTIQEVLPTLVAMHDLGMPLGKYNFLVGSSTEYDELLMSLGIPAANIIHHDNQWISCEQLIYPCFLSFGHLYTPTNYLDRLGDRIRAKSLSETYSPRKLYVSRRRARVRKILNEDELEDALRSKGFECIDPGDLSKIEQVQVFSRTEICVGPHGMGMNNIFFSEHLKAVTEIFTSSWLRPAYWRMCQARGIRYTGYVVDPLNENQDIKIDVPRFIDALEEAHD